MLFPSGCSTIPNYLPTSFEQDGGVSHADAGLPIGDGFRDGGAWDLVFLPKEVFLTEVLLSQLIQVIFRLMVVFLMEA